MNENVTHHLVHRVVRVELRDVLGASLFAVEHQLVDHRAHRFLPHVVPPLHRLGPTALDPNLQQILVPAVAHSAKGDVRVLPRSPVTHTRRQSNCLNNTYTRIKINAPVRVEVQRVQPEGRAGLRAYLPDVLHDGLGEVPPLAVARPFGKRDVFHLKRSKLRQRRRAAAPRRVLSPSL